MPYPRLKQPENFESTRAMGLSRANTETFLLESLFWIIDSNLSCTFQCMEKSQSFTGQNINLSLKSIRVMGLSREHFFQNCLDYWLYRVDAYIRTFQCRSFYTRFDEC